ncbi:MAG: ABC transporter ATP-binding protein [Acidobacteriota bacterium]
MSGVDEKTLTTSQLVVGYREGRKVTKRVSGPLELNLARGELVCLLGPNGAGKSTLMRTLTAMQPALEGEVQLMGEPLTQIPAAERARRLAVVLTDRVAVGMLSARSVVELGRYPHTGWRGRLVARDHQIVDQALTTAGAQELADRAVVELSDGERQKVMIARALAQEPAVLVLDEITAFLDLPRRVEVMRLLRHLAHRENKAVLVSSHDLELALRSADRIWLLSKGGKLVKGSPESLVLSGEFSETFASEGVVFDRSTGTFQLTEQIHGEVQIVGEGEAAAWTRRAVERLGFATLTDSDSGSGSGSGSESDTAERRIEVVDEGPAPRWRWVCRGEVQELGSLDEVISVLEAEQRETTAAPPMIGAARVHESDGL